MSQYHKVALYQSTPVFQFFQSLNPKYLNQKYDQAWPACCLPVTKETNYFHPHLQTPRLTEAFGVETSQVYTFLVAYVAHLIYVLPFMLMQHELLSIK